jgi:hypothetical protein
MMGWMVYGEIEASVGLLPRRAARIISKRRRDAMGKIFQNGEHWESCANLYVACGLSVAW